MILPKATLLLLLVGCGSAGEKPGATGPHSDSGAFAESRPTDSGPTDSGPTDSAASAATPLEVNVEPGVPGTVVVVSWTTPVPATSTVEFGPSLAYGRQTPRGEALVTDHRVMVVGLPASCACFLRAVSVAVDGTLFRSADVSYTTPEGPAGLTFTNELARAGSGEPPWVLALAAARGSVAIVDGDGALIWWRELPEGAGLEQARVSEDRLYVYYNQLSGLATDPTSSTVTKLRLDGAEEHVVPTPHGHHDFLLPGGENIAYIQADIRGYDLEGDGVIEAVVGDAIQVVGPDGASLAQVWNSWDSLTVGGARETPYFPGAWDWLHVNGLWEADGDWYVSSHMLAAILKIDGSTGAILWQLGGDDSDFVFLDGTPRFSHQHSPRILGDRLILFNNTDGEGDPPASYAVEYQVDEAARTVREVRRHERDTPTWSSILGNVDVMTDGSWLVGWGTASVAERVAADGTVLRVLRAAGGARISNVHEAAGLGGPLP